MFGGERDPQSVADERFLVRARTGRERQLAAGHRRLARQPVHIVVDIGVDSTGQLCGRTSTALATGLGITPTRFPGDHTGFAEDAKGFEPVLRAVLAEC
ncbi:hypothetical protein [Kribbella sp. CA-294648]|uniref:hypothetical protein n=1 Tax=Kribbella sp. CA-294648 TaxID=3239948 RepID=UPI003D93D1FE